MRRVAARLLTDCNGLFATDFPIDGLVTRRAAERILKRLALRGLVQHVRGRWMPRSVFLNPTPLQHRRTP
jgi:hypothetical protein